MKFSIMDHSGHSEEAYGAEEIAAGMARFTALVKRGHTAAARKLGEAEYSVTRRFPSDADEVLFVPQLKGG
jgi:hypothetical protein